MYSSNPVPDGNDWEDNNEIENILNLAELLDDLEQVQDTSVLSEWPGFKLVGWGVIIVIDKNFHPSF